MQKIFIFNMFLLAFCLSGCAISSNSPTPGLVFTSIKGPITATSIPVPGNMAIGTSTCENVLGLFSWGDASIRTAIINGHISKVAFVDYETNSFLGIFSTYKTTVYGEKDPSSVDSSITDLSKIKTSKPIYSDISLPPLKIPK